MPGHPRIRAQFTEHLASAKGIVFVVDTSTIARDGAAVAECVCNLFCTKLPCLTWFLGCRHLHTVLNSITKLPPSAHVPPILILANKSDLLSVPVASSREAVAADRVRTILERELEKRRQSSLTGVGVGGLGETAEDEDTGAIQGGLETLGDGSFTFVKWEGGEVKVSGGCVEKQTREKLEASEKTPESRGLDAVLSWIDDL